MTYILEFEFPSGFIHEFIVTITSLSPLNFHLLPSISGPKIVAHPP